MGKYTAVKARSVHCPLAREKGSLLVPPPEDNICVGCEIGIVGKINDAAEEENSPESMRILVEGGLRRQSVIYLKFNMRLAVKTEQVQHHILEWQYMLSNLE